ncbi:MAG TPA: DUF1838 domain-containing protein [Candidatus Caenarcaniphilales bacterium]
MSMQPNQRLPGTTITRNFAAKEFVKVRGSTDGSQAFIAWTGSIYALIPGELKKHLFNIVGMSVARCIPGQDGGWDFTSRELTYYIDTNTGEILHTWENPWTQEVVTVVHVANNPVQGYFKRQFPAQVTGAVTTFVFDLFLTYPNLLAKQPKFLEYSPNPTYQAAELFKLTVPTDDLLNPDQTTVSSLIVSWDRIGPWLPWMKMGTQAGQLIYSAYGNKVEGFTDLPQLLQDEINTRIPLYKNAPTHRLDRSDMTSWSYFEQHFEAYLRREIFPIPEPASE